MQYSFFTGFDTKKYDSRSFLVTGDVSYAKNSFFQDLSSNYPLGTVWRNLVVGDITVENALIRYVLYYMLYFSYL